MAEKDTMKDIGATILRMKAGMIN